MSLAHIQEVLRLQFQFQLLQPKMTSVMLLTHIQHNLLIIRTALSLLQTTSPGLQLRIRNPMHRLVWLLKLHSPRMKTDQPAMTFKQTSFSAAERGAMGAKLMMIYSEFDIIIIITIIIIWIFGLIIVIIIIVVIMIITIIIVVVIVI